MRSEGYSSCLVCVSVCLFAHAILGVRAIKSIMKALKYKPLTQFAYNYSINVLNKCSNIISHRSPKVDTSIFESQHIDLQKSTHRSSKIEGGNIAPTIRHRILSTTALHSV